MNRLVQSVAIEEVTNINEVGKFNSKVNDPYSVKKFKGGIRCEVKYEMSTNTKNCAKSYQPYKSATDYSFSQVTATVSTKSR